MRKTAKKFLALVLTAVMIITAIPLSGFVGIELPNLKEIFAPKAEAATYNGTCGTNVTWTFNEETGTLTISGTGEMTDFSPTSSTPWYTDISSIPWYTYKENIKSILVDYGVVSIGNYAFYGCNSLTSITIPDSVTRIGHKAFDGCKALTSVKINDIAAWCNIYFDGYKSQPLNHAGGDLYLNNTLVTNLVIPDGVTSIDFCKCKSLTSVTIPDSVTSIGASAFNGCTGLTSVTIPNSVTSIGASAFNGCTDLTSVTIPDSVTSIGEDAFYGCKSLTSVAIPESVTSIGNGAFSYCTDLTSITIPDSVTSIGGYAFSNCHELTSITIPDSVTSIGAYTFSYCTDLASITIPNSVTSIGCYAFDGCEALTSVKISDIATWCNINFDTSHPSSNPLYYAKNLYMNNTLVTDLVIPDGVTSISDYAFFDCRSLTSVTIPNSVTSIGMRAFSNCTHLTGVYINDIVAWCNIDFNSNPLYYAKNLYLNNTLVTDLVIPNGVTSIGEDAFYGCKSLTSVTISDSVTSIGEWAFNGCTSLTSVTIGNGVTSIGREAFNHCANLTGVYISDIAAWCNIKFSSGDNFSSNPLYYAGNLYLNNTLVTDLIIPDGVISISDCAFYKCKSLTSLSIPRSVTNINANTFGGCTGLTSVKINDIAAWCNIDFTFINGRTSNPLYYAENLYLNNTLVKDLIIPDSVTSIGEYVFSDCTSLTSVTIPNSVTSIGMRAFSDCTNLTSVTIPDSVTSIGEAAFDYTAYYNDESNRENNELYIGNHLIESNYNSLGEYTIKPGTITIADSAFVGNSNITSVTIPDSVTSIGKYAFYYCTSLTNITIPDSVIIIDDYAFEECIGLTSVTFGNGIKSIGEGAFSECNSLTGVYISDIANWCNIDFNFINGRTSNPLYYAENLYLNNTLVKDLVIPDSVTSIGEYVFSDCTSLTSVTIPNSVTSIGEETFSGCTSLTSVTIPDSVTSIGDSVFYGCKNLTSITIPDSVTSIDDFAFSGCTSLTSVTIGNGVTSIGESAFNYCKSLTSVAIPDSVISIGDYAFSNCTSLTSITIPDSVTSIGESAFNYCEGLKDIYISDIAAWCNIDFNSNPLSNPLYHAGNLYLNKTLVTDLVIPDGVTSISDCAFRSCESLTSVEIPDSVTSIGDGAFEDCDSLTSITIPDSVTSIGDGAFEDCDSLTSITIPDSVTSIGEAAFSECFNLENITIGNGVTNIGGSALYNCSSLTNITVSADNDYYSSQDSVLFNKDKTELILYPIGNTRTSYDIPESVTSIGNGAFSYCTDLTSITIPDSVTSIGASAFEGCKNLTSITIPNGVTYIYAFTFFECGLKSIIIPSSVIYIERYAFYNNGLGKRWDIYYSGTRNEWNNIKIKDYNDALTGTDISDGYYNDDLLARPTMHFKSSEPHVCEYTIFANHQMIHPHYAVYRCSCGAEKTGTETGTLDTCEICNPSKIPEEKADIEKPSQTTISYGDKIILHFNNDVELPEGAKVVWTADNENFSYEVSADGKTCTISPEKSGDTTFTATVVDKDGNVISEEYSQTMTAKAGFFQKIIAFFKSIFGLTKVIPEAVKFVF